MQGFSRSILTCSAARTLLSPFGETVLNRDFKSRILFKFLAEEALPAGMRTSYGAEQGFHFQFSFSEEARPPGKPSGYAGISRLYEVAFRTKRI